MNAIESRLEKSRRMRAIRREAKRLSSDAEQKVLRVAEELVESKLDEAFIDLCSTEPDVIEQLVQTAGGLEVVRALKTPGNGILATTRRSVARARERAARRA